MALTIPTGSSVSEAMITDWQSRFGVDRDTAIAELLDIEDVKVELPEFIKTVSTYNALVERHYSALDRLPASQRVVPKGRAAAIVASIAAGAILMASLIFSGANNTRLTGFQHVTSTINPSSLTGWSVTHTLMTVQADADDSITISRIPDAWKVGTPSSSVMLSVDMSASGTARLTFQNTTSVSVDLQSDVVGFDIWRH
jgi:hypothetical protein